MAWIDKDKERKWHKEYKKIRYQNDSEFKEKEKARRRKYTATHPEQLVAQNQRWAEKISVLGSDAFFTDRLSTIRVRSKEKSFDFNLTKKYLKDIFPKDKKCPALGIEFQIGSEGGRATSPSVDRIDNSKGYIKGNVIWVSSLANMIMTSATPQQVLDVGKFFKKQMESNNEHNRQAQTI
tara:strand:+ start:56 stop:595 length:540 start_codon:yes stop_codon:yes gene_type:complete